VIFRAQASRRAIRMSSEWTPGSGFRTRPL